MIDRMTSTKKRRFMREMIDAQGRPQATQRATVTPSS